MIIRHLGHASFRINLKDGTSIVTDPYDENVGFAMPSTPADIVTISHEHHDHNFIGQLAPKHVIRGTEQAQFSGLTIEGFATFHDDVSGAKRGKNTVYLFEAEGLRVLHLGDLGHMPGDDLIENLLPIDVLMIPVGGVFTIDAEMAAELTHRFGARITVPMHYSEPALSFGLGSLQAYLDAVDMPYERKFELDPNASASSIVVLESGNGL